MVWIVAQVGAFFVTVKLWVKDGKFTQFDAFETAAFAIMARYGARVLSVAKDHASTGIAPHETHNLEFPDRAAFEAYRSDPDLTAMAAMRAACIAKTEVAFS